jgi:hypothetical protein
MACQVSTKICAYFFPTCAQYMLGFFSGGPFAEIYFPPQLPDRRRDRPADSIFLRGFTFVELVHLSKLRKVKLPADGYRLVLLLMENASYSGQSAKPFNEMAEELGVWPSRISALIAELEKLGVAQKVGGRKSCTVLINPSFCFRGPASEQHKALEEWAKHRPFNLVKPADPQVLAS